MTRTGLATLALLAIAATGCGTSDDDRVMAESHVRSACERTKQGPDTAPDTPPTMAQIHASFREASDLATQASRLDERWSALERAAAKMVSAYGDVKELAEDIGDLANFDGRSAVRAFEVQFDAVLAECRKVSD